MKKILSSVAAVALAAALISCGESKDNTYNYSGAQDTVLTIGAPIVTAKAYPGVNYITWSPVAQAASYELYRTADGVAGSQKIDAVTGTVTSYADIGGKGINELVNGVSYKYTVIAVPQNSATAPVPQRAVYMQSNAGSASVIANVPAAGTKISDFTDLYTKNFINKYYKDVETTKKNVKITFAEDEIGGGNYLVSIPATAGYKFGLKFINETLVDDLRLSKVASSLKGLYLEDYNANFSKTTLSAGTYKVYATMQAVADSYYPTPVVYEVDSYTVNALDVITATGTPAAEYKDSENVNVYWTPAILRSTNAAAPIGNYKVYRYAIKNTNVAFDEDKEAGEKLEPVTAEITEVKRYAANTNKIDTVVSNTGAKSGEDEIITYYRLTDKVPNNKVAYRYFVVNTAGGEYESFSNKAYNSTTVAAYAQQTTDAPKFVDAETLAISNGTVNENTIKIKVQKANDKQTLALSYVTLTTTDWNANGSVNTYDKFLPSDFKAIGIDKNNDITDNTFISYDVANVAKGTYLFRLTATEANRAPQSAYTIVYVVDPAKRAEGVTIQAIDSQKKLVIMDRTSDIDSTFASYNYELITVKEEHPTAALSTNVVTVTSTPKTVKLEAASVSNADWNDADKKWTKYGLKNIVQRGDNGKSITDDAFRWTTYPFWCDDVTTEKKDNYLTTWTFSVRKSLASDASVYAFTDNQTNGQVSWSK